MLTDFQDVIPQALLDHYLSMTDPSRAQTVDSEIAKHCAYSLPAVAYTLGRRHWPCLKDLYETLASDMQVSKKKKSIDRREAIYSSSPYFVLEGFVLFKPETRHS